MAPFGAVGTGTAAGAGLGRVTRVADDFPRRFVIRSVGWLKVGVHWHRGRSVPCVGEGCEACWSSEPRAMAYVAAWALDPAGRETPVIIEAPVAATLKMEEHEALENGEAWLGAVIELQRAGRGVRRPLVGKVVGRRSNDPEPVELEAVTDVLCAVWRLPRLTAFGSRELWLDAVRLRLQEPGHYGEDVPMEAPARRAAR